FAYNGDLWRGNNGIIRNRGQTKQKAKTGAAKSEHQDNGDINRQQQHKDRYINTTLNSLKKYDDDVERQYQLKSDLNFKLLRINMEIYWFFIKVENLLFFYGNLIKILIFLIGKIILFKKRTKDRIYKRYQIFKDDIYSND
uniref:Ycf1 n=1 Tax=Romanomermis culicivorax TaxID=13658 RepID=A0A915J112_ROMCU